MSDLPLLLRQIQGWAASCETHHDDVLEMMALLRAGHPRAQDFDPTGHGGSDPTSANGIRPDNAVRDGKAYVKAIERAWTAMREVDGLSHHYRDAVRPVRQPDDPQDVWCVLHLQLDAHEPRYRNDLCRPCAERKYQTGDFPTLDDVRYHTVHARWPRTRVDPKAPPTRIASVERLQLHTEAINADEAAAVLMEGTG